MTKDIKERNKKLAPNIFYAANLTETRKLINEKIRASDIILIMGAGDIYKIADELTE